jgi:hypothetical protein
VGLLGILLALGLLIWLAYGGWSLLLLAPAMALVAAAIREPLLAHWTQRFMGSPAPSRVIDPGLCTACPSLAPGRSIPSRTTARW